VAAIVITASAIIPASGYSYTDLVSAATITQGQACYVNASNQAALAQCDGTAIEATFAGIALNSALASQPIRLITGGSLGMGVCLTAGVPLCVGATAGQIVSFSDLVSTNKVAYIGTPSTTSNLVMGINNTGVTLA